MSPEGSGTPPKSSGNAGYHPKARSYHTSCVQQDVLRTVNPSLAPLCQRGAQRTGPSHRSLCKNLVWTDFQSKRRDTLTPAELGRSAPDMRRADHPRTAPFLCPSCWVLSILAKVSRKVAVRLKTRPSVAASTVSTQK